MTEVGSSEEAWQGRMAPVSTCMEKRGPMLVVMIVGAAGSETQVRMEDV